MANNKRVKFWRGTVDSYNILVNAGVLDYWTRYSVKQKDGSWKEYYGDNLISEPTGQLLPVLDIVAALPSVLNPGDRYLVSDKGEHYIVEIGIEKDNGTGYLQTTRVIPLKEGISVRVKKKGYKSYLLVGGEIITYDEVNGGMYE